MRRKATKPADSAPHPEKKAMMTPEEREQHEKRIAEISQQLRTSSEGNLPGPGVPYELSKDEIDLLYEERDRLTKMLDEDAGLAA